MVPGDSVAIDGVIQLNNAIEGETIGSVIRLGQNPVIEPLEVTENGTYEVPEGVEGFNPVIVAFPSELNFLKTLTFVDALGSSGRQTVSIPEEWGKYDFLLLVPDLVIAAQEGQTKGNWLWYGLYRKSNNVGTTNYDGYSDVGTRDRGRHTVVISSTATHWMIGCWQSGRAGTFKKQMGEKLSDLKIMYGTHYSESYGLLNGTVKIYGGKF